MKPVEFTRIVEGKRYSTKSATLLAHDAYWDGHNFERHGRNCYLYRTPKGAYFTVNLTMWQGEFDKLVPVSEAEGKELYEGPLTEHEVRYEEAFPNAVVEDA